MDEEYAADPFEDYELPTHQFDDLVREEEVAKLNLSLPMMVLPSATHAMQMRSVEDTELYMVADERKVQAPCDSNSARRAVLNALRTIVPCRAVFRVNDQIVIDLLLYDFFYRGTELRMVIITLDTQEMFDAFAFKQDVLHLLASCQTMISSSETKIDWLWWLKREPNFDGFYIKCQQLNQYQSLQRTICSAAKHLKFNQSLVNWLNDVTRPFFSLARVPSVPFTWKPIPADLASKLYATPELFALTDQFTCPQYTRTGKACPCDFAKHDHYAEGSNSAWSHRRLLPYVPSSLPWQVRLFAQPCMADIRSIFWLTTTTLVKKEEPTPSFTHYPVYDAAGTKITCQLCSEPALCYLVECCKPSQPLYCHQHAIQELGKAGLVDMLTCPMHAITSRVAQLL